MLHVAVNAISLSDTFFKKLPRTHSAVAFSKTKPAALGFDLDVKAKISELKPPDNPLKSGVSAGFFFASCDCCPSLDQDTGILPLPAPACTGAMIYALPAGSANGNRSTTPIVRCSGLTSPQSGHGCNPLSAASCPMRPQYRRDEAYFRPVSDNFRP